VIAAPSPVAYAEARSRLDDLAKPVGALGRLEDLAAWVACLPGDLPAAPLDRVRAVILAGDHGVSHDGVSAYPGRSPRRWCVPSSPALPAPTVWLGSMDVALRVLDLGVDDDLDDVPAEVSVYHLGPPSRSTRPMP
jgi:nicotinate-nucleotide--dimethylbenzimidazole phosphoribosyltransferase